MTSSLKISIQVTHTAFNTTLGRKQACHVTHS